MGPSPKARNTLADSRSSGRPISTPPLSGPPGSRARQRCPSKFGPFNTVVRMGSGPALAAAEIERVFGEEYGRAVAVLVRAFHDIDMAEEAVQDAFRAALERWPSAGLPPSPAGWIITTARNRAIDRLRREASRDDRHGQAAALHASSAADGAD